MADNYMKTSFQIEAGTTENAEKIDQWLNGGALPVDLADRLTESVGADMVDSNGETGERSFFGSIANAEAEGTKVWVYSDESFDAEALTSVLAYAIETMPEAASPIMFTWAETCSKPRLDEFGGGSCIIIRDPGHPADVRWMGTSQWIAEQMADLSRDGALEARSSRARRRP